MSGHFSAFSLVDKITDFESGRRAKGRFQVPANISRFPSPLAAEAVGQLAAWNAIAHLGFRVRPVAGLAAGIRFGPQVHPGQSLDLETIIESCEMDAVSYSGWAEVDGVRVMELDHSVGPMLPLEDFDSPQAMRSRFELLCGPGAPSGRFGGVPEPDIEIVEEVPGERLRANLRIPKEAEFFSDHFPRRPVFPGTLLLSAQIDLALRFSEGWKRWLPGADLAPTHLRDTKLRAFVPPGAMLDLRIDFAPSEEPGKVKATSRVQMNGKSIAGGKLEIGARN
jgi:3-hydroxymyristoyl/3-hydroxydecanoyl-(acyl carrier protein) dehydratase